MTLNAFITLVRITLGDYFTDADGKQKTIGQRYPDTLICKFIARAIVDKESVYNEGYALDAEVEDATRETVITPEPPSRYKTLIAEIVRYQHAPLHDRTDRNQDGSATSVKVSSNKTTWEDLVMSYKFRKDTASKGVQLVDTLGVNTGGIASGQ
jgi:hypothetical protein